MVAAFRKLGLGARRVEVSPESRSPVNAVPEVELDARGAYSCRVTMRGFFRPGWTGNLATGLAEQGLDIRRGHAVEDLYGYWQGEFDLERSPAGAHPADIGYVALAESATYSGVDLPLELFALKTEFVATDGGTLLLHVEGRDRVGFLAALLTRLAQLSLFPSKLDLSTLGGRATDRLWLKGLGGTLPSLDAPGLISRRLMG